LTVRFAGLTALDAVDFTVRPGTVHALIGPNGAGKSTCFNVLSGVYRATAGSVLFGEHELTGMPPHRIADLGVARIFQNLALPPLATVEDSLLLGRHRLTRTGFLSAGLRLPRRPARNAGTVNAYARSPSSSASRPTSAARRAPSRTGSRSSPNSPAPSAWSRACCSWTSRSRA
jgi:branched-chain amino acid transport system ATP-binding protein